ncbi:MAG: glycosyltransferase family 39 protein, partial [Anaerolineales bacterium]|nr:glycosyltransferase family 39 protein [Anaerolineales bacterium]
MGRTLTENGADGRQALPGLNGALLVVLLGTWLRFHWIDAQSLWYDEGNTAHMTLRTPGEIVAAAAADIHPPGYYLALTGWSRMAGRSEFALRGFSAFTGIVLLGVLYRLARDAWGATGGSVALFFGAVHPALVYYSQEARMYMLASMLGAVAVFVAGRLLAAKRGERERVLAFTYVGVGAFGLYSHYTFAYVLIAINVAALWQFFRGRSRVLRIKVSNWALLQFGVVALYSAWM